MSKIIKAEDLQAEILRRRYIELLEKADVFPSQNNWDYIISTAMGGDIGRLLYRKYLVSMLTPTPDRVDCHLAAIREFPRYLEAVSYEDAVSAVFSDTDTLPDETIKLIKRYKLFSAEQLHRLLDEGKIDIVIECLSVFKREYTCDDLMQMKSLLHCLRHLPETGRYEHIQNVFKSGVRYICPNGHINNQSAEYCSRPDCGLNIYGLTHEQTGLINAFENIVDVLDDMLDTTEEYSQHM